MPEINCKELHVHIKKAEKEGFSGLYLIHGEEMMRRNAFDELLNALLPASSSDRSLNYHPVDGTPRNVVDAVEQANTFSFMSGRKVVAFLDSGIFYSKENEKGLLEKAKEAHSDKDLKKAAKYFMSLMSLLKLSFDDVSGDNRGKSLKIEGQADSRWIDDIAAYCVGNGLGASPDEDNASFFQKAVEKGFPKGNHLIVTADFVDKRLSLYKAVNKNGVIIDCQIPKGDSRTEKETREKIIFEMMNEALLKSGKTIEKAAYQAMFEMTGFDLRTFLNNLEKLISYTGERKKITLADVESVLKRTRIDPIYEFTNAVSEKNPSNSLFYLDSLLGSDIHPLQALSALINQFRKIICVKGFTESGYGKAWEPGCSYPRFASAVMPAIEEYDNALLAGMEETERSLSDDEPDGESADKKKKPSKKKSKAVSDILISKTGKNPYALYMLAGKSDNFTKEELISIFEILKEADLELKSSGRNPKLVIENAILHICRKK